MKRKEFIRQASIAASGITLLSLPVFGKNAPSNKVTIAIIGLNGRGNWLSKCFAQMDNVNAPNH